MLSLLWHPKPSQSIMSRDIIALMVLYAWCYDYSSTIMRGTCFMTVLGWFFQFPVRVLVAVSVVRMVYSIPVFTLEWWERGLPVTLRVYHWFDYSYSTILPEGEASYIRWSTGSLSILFDFWLLPLAQLTWRQNYYFLYSSYFTWQCSQFLPNYFISSSLIISAAVDNNYKHFWLSVKLVNWHYLCTLGFSLIGCLSLTTETHKSWENLQSVHIS